ncbi:MAG: hypothetical protein U1D55_19670 [Phycisphaerae bacterium]
MKHIGDNGKPIDSKPPAGAEEGFFEPYVETNDERLQELIDFIQTNVEPETGT